MTLNFHKYKYWTVKILIDELLVQYAVSFKC